MGLSGMMASIPPRVALLSPTANWFFRQVITILPNNNNHAGAAALSKMALSLPLGLSMVQGSVRIFIPANFTPLYWYTG